MISGQFEIHLGMRQEAELSTDILGDSDLALAGDLHSNTSTGKGNPILALVRNVGYAAATARAVRSGGARGEHNEHPDHQGSRRHSEMLQNTRANVIEGKVNGLPKLTHLSLGRRKVVRKEWLDQWMEANKTQ